MSVYEKLGWPLMDWRHGWISTSKNPAEDIAKWFFQVDDPRQRECEALVNLALKRAAQEKGGEL